MLTSRLYPLRKTAAFAASRRRATSGAHFLASRRASAFDRWCLAAFIEGLRHAPVRCVLWDGTTRAAADDPVATVHIGDRATLVRLLWKADLAFGEAYTEGRIEVEGDLLALMTAMARRLESEPPRRLARHLHRHGASVAPASRNARYHYDLGNDFYSLWLDEQLVYTCAYFASPTMSLEAAQRAKLDLVARKLDLKPGERVIEAGCGWGALGLHLAREYGVHVRAWNVSTEQVAWARQRARDEGLADVVEFVEGDYRTIDGECDAFVSVGMLEHVGASQYGELGGVIDRCLHPQHGRGLLHFIGRNVPAPMGTWITRYIFPGAYLPSLREALEGVLEPRGFSVLDVENLRPHYALTLDHWRTRFERVSAQVATRFGDAFTRMWRLYLTEAEAGFSGGSLQLFQVVFARGEHDAMPWTRSHLYQHAERAT